MADIDWRHYDQIVELNRLKGIDSQAGSVVECGSKEETCFT